MAKGTLFEIVEKAFRIYKLFINNSASFLFEMQRIVRIVLNLLGEALSSLKKFLVR